MFDLDGTLLNTAPAIIESYKYLFNKYRKDIVFDEEKQLEVIGPSLFVMFEKYFPDKDVDELVKEYREYNFKIHKEFVSPMNNAEALLKQLKEEGYKIGVVSTKLKDAVEMGLKMFNLDEYIELVIGYDSVKNQKPDPEGLLLACKEMNHTQDECIYIEILLLIYKPLKMLVYILLDILLDEDRKQALIDSKPNKIIKDLIEVLDILKEDNKSWTKDMM